MGGNNNVNMWMKYRTLWILLLIFGGALWAWALGGEPYVGALVGTFFVPAIDIKKG